MHASHFALILLEHFAVLVGMVMPDLLRQLYVINHSDIIGLQAPALTPPIPRLASQDNK